MLHYLFVVVRNLFCRRWYCHWCDISPHDVAEGVLLQNVVRRIGHLLGSWSSHVAVGATQEGMEAKLKTGFLFGCVLYRMLCSVHFRACRSMQFCTGFAILDTDPRTKLDQGISAPFLPGATEVKWDTVQVTPTRRWAVSEDAKNQC